MGEDFASFLIEGSYFSNQIKFYAETTEMQ